MSQFKKAPSPVSTEKVEDFINGANERVAAKSSATSQKRENTKMSFVLKLEQEDHELLKSIADSEERSMQWILGKLTSSGIRKKAAELRRAAS
jgi:hypothetical protein